MRKRALIVCALVLVPSPAAVPAVANEGVYGAVHRIDPKSLATLGRIDSDVADDEFGTTVATGPGADGGGRLIFLRDEQIVSSFRGVDIGDPNLSRLGEDLDEIGHPPGISNALVIGAPGEPAEIGAARTSRDPAVLVLAHSGTSVSREVLRVTGPADSMFGWQIEATDSQFPRASYNASFLVAAPHEDDGKKSRRAGAVYKFDSLDGRQLWRFRGERAGELAGYSLQEIPDQNGDGWNDVLAGAPGARDLTVPGRVYVLSGLDGAVIARIEAPAGAALFGFALEWQTPGLHVGAPGTQVGKKRAAGKVYSYATLDAAPQSLSGRKRDEWFGSTLKSLRDRLFVGSLLRHRKADRDGRGSVTVFDARRRVRTLRGDAGTFFGRTMRIGQELWIGAPGAPPLLLPE